MIKNQVYNYLQQYLADYLFGFDKSQLEVAILSGHIELRDVNVRPDKINPHLSAMKLPIVLKAGMIGKLCLQYSLLSFLSSPFDVSIDDVQIILGPNVSAVVSQANSDASRDTDGNKYDSNNCFNIFQNDIVYSTKSPEIQKKQKRSTDATQPKKAASFLEKYLTEILQNMTLTINRLHIRYEDDYFSSLSPCAFGLICQSISSYSSKTEWKFASLESSQFSRVQPAKYCGNIRETNIINVRVYWKSQAEMIIPISLWESTKACERQIFEAISLEDLRALMQKSFAEDNLIEEFSLYSSVVYRPDSNEAQDNSLQKDMKVAADILLTKIRINMKPSTANDAMALGEYIQNYALIKELKAYRPLRRPITGPATHDDQTLARTRLLVARDWFFFAIWSMRVKKALKQVCGASLVHEKRMEEFIRAYRRIIASADLKGAKMFNDAERQKICKAPSDRKNQEELKQLLHQMKIRYDDEKRLEYEDKQEAMKSLERTVFCVRVQEVGLKIEGKEAGKDGVNLYLGNLALRNKNLSNSITLDCCLQEMKINCGRNTTLDKGGRTTTIETQRSAASQQHQGRNCAPSERANEKANYSISEQQHVKSLFMNARPAVPSNVTMCNPTAIPSIFGKTPQQSGESSRMERMGSCFSSDSHASYQLKQMPTPGRHGVSQELSAGIPNASQCADSSMLFRLYGQPPGLISQGVMGNKSSGSIGFRMSLQITNSLASAFTYNCEAELGLMALNLNISALQSFCETFSGYKELYWFRSIGNKPHTSLKQLKNASKSKTGSMLAKIKALTEDWKPINSFDSLDTICLHSNLQLGIRLNEASISIEDEDSALGGQFVRIATPKGSLFIKKDAGNENGFQANVCGISISCTKSVIIGSMIYNNIKLLVSPYFASLQDEAPTESPFKSSANHKKKSRIAKPKTSKSVVSNASMKTPKALTTLHTHDTIKKSSLPTSIPVALSGCFNTVSHPSTSSHAPIIDYLPTQAIISQLKQKFIHTSLSNASRLSKQSKSKTTAQAFDPQLESEDSEVKHTESQAMAHNKDRSDLLNPDEECEGLKREANDSRKLCGRDKREFQTITPFGNGGNSNGEGKKSETTTRKQKSVTGTAVSSVSRPKAPTNKGRPLITENSAIKRVYTVVEKENDTAEAEETGINAVLVFPEHRNISGMGKSYRGSGTGRKMGINKKV